VIVNENTAVEELGVQVEAQHRRYLSLAGA
jgi:hypothetical protein